MKYEELSTMIKNDFRKSKLDFDKLIEIWLPTTLYSIFYRETVGKGYECSWWSIPVIGKDIAFITFISRTEK